jgi:hypothetical protein
VLLLQLLLLLRLHPLLVDPLHLPLMLLPVAAAAAPPAAASLPVGPRCP